MGIGNERENYHRCQAVQHKRYESPAYEADHHAGRDPTNRRLVFRLGVDPSGYVARGGGGYKNAAPEEYLNDARMGILPLDANRCQAGGY